MKKYSIIFIFVLCLILFISGCTTQDLKPDQSSENQDIICEVFYRQGGEQSFEETEPIVFGDGNDKQTRSFEGLLFEAYFQDDEYEGRVLSIAIVHLETDTEISRQLYQFDPQNPPENQFIGGHGFTGLNYVFQPKSAAEMQYFCGVE